MPVTRTTVIRSFRAMGVVIAICIIVAYAIWRSLNYARGPMIVVFEPKNGSSIASSTVIVSGRAERVNRLSVNGQAISVDERGAFKERIVIFPGLNKLTLSADDQFGRSTKLTLDLVGTVELPAMKAASKPAVPATSTTASTSRAR